MSATLKTRPSRPHYDLVVLGSGPGGQRAAIQAAKLKKSVLVIDRKFLGGHCLHHGTIPSKTLREAALVTDCLSPRALAQVMARKEGVIAAEMDVVTRQLGRNSVECVGGEARFLSWYEIEIQNGEEKYVVESDFIVIATGTSPTRPKGVEFDGRAVFDSDSILTLANLPKRLAVIGSGVIGCEYASIFARMGVQTHLINKYDQLLRGVDGELVENIRQHFTENGITLHLGVTFENVHSKKDASGNLVASVLINGKEEQFDALLCCLGRRGNTDTLNLVAANLTANENGIIAVNESFQTPVPHIYAVGDVIGPPALAAASAEQGRLAAAHAFGLGGGKFPGSFPYGIYTIPEISWAGQHEEELKKNGVPFIVGRALYKELARGKILGDEHGMLKLIVHQDTRRILGVHILGTGATELVHIGQVAMDLGADIEFFVNNVFNYPTLAEAYKVAAYHAYNQLLSKA